MKTTTRMVLNLKCNLKWVSRPFIKEFILYMYKHVQQNLYTGTENQEEKKLALNCLIRDIFNSRWFMKYLITLTPFSMFFFYKKKIKKNELFMFDL